MPRKRSTEEAVAATLLADKPGPSDAGVGAVGGPEAAETLDATGAATPPPADGEEKPKRGRPKGSKNRPKEDATPELSEDELNKAYARRVTGYVVMSGLFISGSKEALPTPDEHGQMCEGWVAFAEAYGRIGFPAWLAPVAGMAPYYFRIFSMDCTRARVSGVMSKFRSKKSLANPASAAAPEKATEETPRPA